MAKVELKQPIIQEISDHIKDAQSVVVVDYRGLTVAEDTQLRKQLRESGITYKVYKNTMMNFAFKDTDFESLAPVLEGPSAIAISSTDELLSKFLGSIQSPITNLARVLNQIAEKGGADSAAAQAAEAAPAEEAEAESN